MSLSPWEQDALDSIKDGLTDSDPGLVARLGIFTRLASGEAMPVREKLQVVSRQAVQRGARRRLYLGMGAGRAMLLVWLITTLTLISAALASSRASGPGTCAGFWGSLCGHEVAAAQPARSALPIP